MTLFPLDARDRTEPDSDKRFGSGSTSPEDLLVDLRIGLDEFKPTLIVPGSISAIGPSTSQHGFRQLKARCRWRSPAAKARIESA